jgi:hypothetical protein
MFLCVNPHKIKLQVNVVKTTNLTNQDHPTLPTPLTKLLKQEQKEYRRMLDGLNITTQLMPTKQQDKKCIIFPK